MTFHDLPEAWQSRPLTDPRIAADVLDLFADRRTRQERGLILVLCDERGIALAPVILDALPASPARSQFTRRLRGILRHFPGMRLAVGYARPGPAWPTASDLRWHEAVAAACVPEVELLAFGIVNIAGCWLLSPRAELAG